jgi:hypothetical protein
MMSEVGAKKVNVVFGRELLIQFVIAVVAIYAAVSPGISRSETADSIRYRIICSPNRANPQMYLNGHSLAEMTASYRIWYVAIPVEFLPFRIDLEVSGQQALEGYLIDSRGRHAFAQDRATGAERNEFEVLASEWDCKMVES